MTTKTLPELPEVYSNRQLDEIDFKKVMEIVEDILGPDHEKHVRGCHEHVGQIRHGGNTWGCWCNFLSFMRDYMGWSHPEIPRYNEYEKLIIHGGYRYMNYDFCLISDFPVLMDFAIRHTDYVHVRDNKKGPVTAWSDGTELYFYDGIRIPAHLAWKGMYRPDLLTVDDIDSLTNNDEISVMMELFGLQRYLDHIGAQEIDRKKNDIEGTVEVLMKDSRSKKWFQAVDPSGRLTPPMRVPENMETCEDVREWFQGEMSFNLVGRT